jgi:hypothetical protein
LTGLLRADEDAAPTAADAGVTVMATEVLTLGEGSAWYLVVLSVDEGVGGSGDPFLKSSDVVEVADGRFISMVW